MVVYEITSPHLDEPIWVLTIHEVMARIHDRGLNDYSVQRLTLRERVPPSELQWAMQRGNAYVIQREVIA